MSSKSDGASASSIQRSHSVHKSYDYLLKFLLVGDSDVGKHEMINDFEDGSLNSPYTNSSGKIELYILI